MQEIFISATWEWFTIVIIIEAQWCIYEWVNSVFTGSGNGLTPTRHQAITWTNADILPVGHLVINFSNIFVKISKVFCNKIHLDAVWKCWYHCLDLNAYITILVENYGISNTIVLEIP